MTKTGPLLEQNKQFAAAYTPGPLGPPGRADVEHLLAAPSLATKVSVSGHVYDIATGRVTTVLDARHPQFAGNN